MLRLLGGICVLVFASYGGFYMSGRLKSRRDFLHSMAESLTYIESEIEFGHYELKNIFMRIDKASAVYDFFKKCAEGLNKSGIRCVWERSIAECGETIPLKNEDIDVLLQLGAQIGMSDVAGQKTAIRRAVTHLDTFASTADKEYARLGKTYRSCGVLLGIFFLIIVI